MGITGVQAIGKAIDMELDSNSTPCLPSVVKQINLQFYRNSST